MTRRDLEMNTLAYTFNFTKFNAQKAILLHENFKLKNKEHVDIMLINMLTFCLMIHFSSSFNY